MLNIAFSFVSLYNEGQSALHELGVLTSIDASTHPLNDECPAENSEPDTSEELLQENFEIGLFVHHDALISPFESAFQWHLNEIPGYQNHVAELNSRPPKAA